MRNTSNQLFPKRSERLRRESFPRKGRREKGGNTNAPKVRSSNLPLDVVAAAAAMVALLTTSPFSFALAAVTACNVSRVASFPPRSHQLPVRARKTPEASRASERASALVSFSCDKSPVPRSAFPLDAEARRKVKLQRAQKRIA